MNLSIAESVRQSLTAEPQKGYELAQRCGLSFEDTYAALVRLYDAGEAHISIPPYNQDDIGLVA
jgi:hypothetical protein